MSAAPSRPSIVVLTLLVASLVSLGCTAMPKSLSKAFNKSPLGNKDAKTIEQRLSMTRLIERSSPEEARRMYLAILEEDPNQRVAHHRLAVIAAGDNKFEEAERGFQKALSLGQPDAALLTDYGYALFLQHRLPESEKVLRDALALDPRNTAATNNLAMSVGQMGRYDEALKLFREGSTDAEAHANLGYIMSLRGDFDQAKHCYSHALTLNPELRSAGVAMIQLAEREYAMAGTPLPPLPKRHIGPGNGPQPSDEDRTQVQQLAVTQTNEPLSTTAPSIGQVPPKYLPQPGAASGLATMAPYANNDSQQATQVTYTSNGQSIQPQAMTASYAEAQPPAGAHITGVAPSNR